MSTILFFPAHPDDEASQTAVVMVRAAAEGHRVVVVYATNGDHGDAPDDLGNGGSVVDRRRAEAARAAEVLGTARVAWLGYADSGMRGWDQNDVDGSFQEPIRRSAPRRSPTSSTRRTQTSSSDTTGTAEAATPTASRCTTSSTAPSCWRRSRRGCSSRR